MSPRRRQLRAGFTLIEMMVVVAIIGVLAAVALPAYQGYVDSAHGSEVTQIVRPYREMVQEFYEHRGRFPTDNEDLGIPEADFIRSRTVERLYVRGPRIVAELGDDVGREFPEGRYEVVACIVPGSPASPLRWGCADDEGESPYVPADGSPGDD